MVLNQAFLSWNDKLPMKVIKVECFTHILKKKQIKNMYIQITTDYQYIQIH